MPNKTQNILIPRADKINKSYSIKKLKELLSKVKNDETDEKFDENQKTQVIQSILSRIDYIQKYYSKSKWKKENEIISITYNQDEINSLYKDLKLLQQYKQDDILKLKDVIKAKSLSKDTLNQEEIQTNKQNQEQQTKLLQTTQELLRKVNGIATNINQIARAKNQARIFKKDYNLTSDEKTYILNTTAQLEQEILSLTNYHNI